MLMARVDSTSRSLDVQSQRMVPQKSQVAILWRARSCQTWKTGRRQYEQDLTCAAASRDCQELGTRPILPRSLAGDKSQVSRSLLRPKRLATLTLDDCELSYYALTRARRMWMQRSNQLMSSFPDSVCWIGTTYTRTWAPQGYSQPPLCPDAP